MELSAYHEAAHVFLARRLGGRVLSSSLDEDLDATASGCGRTEVLWPTYRRDSEELRIASARVALAGPAAEIVLSGEVQHPALVEAWSPDWDEACRQARALEVDDVRTWCEERLKGIIALFARDSVWPAIAALADHLAAHGELSEPDIELILDAWTL